MYDVKLLSSRLIIFLFCFSLLSIEVYAAPTIQNCCPISADEVGIMAHYEELSKTQYNYDGIHADDEVYYFNTVDGNEIPYTYGQARADWLKEAQESIDSEIEYAKKYVIDCNNAFQGIVSTYDSRVQSSCNNMNYAYSINYNVQTQAEPEMDFDPDEQKKSYEYCIGKTAPKDSSGLFGSKDPFESFYEESKDEDLVPFIDSKTYKINCNYQLLDYEAYKECYISNSVGKCLRTCYNLYGSYEDIACEFLGTPECDAYNEMFEKFESCNNQCDSDFYGTSDYSKEMNDCLWENHLDDTCWVNSYVDARKNLFLQACRNAYGAETDEFKFKYKFIYGSGDSGEIVLKCSKGMQYNKETGNCDPIYGTKSGDISLNLMKTTFEYGSDKDLEITVNYRCQSTDVDSCEGEMISLELEPQDIVGNIKFNISYPENRYLTNEMSSIKVKIAPMSVKLGSIDIKDPIKVLVYQKGQKKNAKEFVFNMPDLDIKTFEFTGEEPMDQNTWGRVKVSVQGPEKADYLYVFKSVPGSRFRIDGVDFPFVAIHNTKDRDFTINWESPMLSQRISLEEVYLLIAANTSGKMGLKAADYLASEHIKKSLGKINSMGKTPPITMEQFNAYSNTIKAGNYAYTGIPALSQQNTEWNRKQGEGEDWIYHQGKKVFSAVSAVEGFVGNFLPDKLNVPGTVLSIGLEAVGGWYQAVDATIALNNAKEIEKIIPVQMDVIVLGYETKSASENVTVKGLSVMIK